MSKPISIISSVLGILFVLWLLASYLLVLVSAEMIYLPSNSKDLSYNIPVEVTQLLNSKNEKIEILTAAKDKRAENIILYLHGNVGRIPRLVEEMSQYGMVISPAYPGYSGSEGKPSTSGLYETVDLTMKWLVEQGITPAQITVIGHSMGGSTAIYAGSQYPDLKEVILVSTFYSMQAMCETKYSILCVLSGDVLNSSRMASNVKVKIRQFHHPKDQVVPYTQGKDLFNLIGSNDKQFYELNGDGPDYHNSFSIEELLKV